MAEKTGQRLTFLINVAYATTVIALVYVVYKYIFGLILPFLLAFGIVSLINPLIRKITRKLGRRQAAISVVVMLILYLLIGLLLFWLTVQIVYGIGGLFRAIPSLYEKSILPNMQRIWENLSGLINGAPRELQDQMSTIQESLIRGAGSALQSISQKGIAAISGMTAKIPSFLIAFTFTIMLSFFISAQYDKVTLFLKGQMPPKARRVLEGIRSIIKSTVIKYLGAVFKLMGITFVELSIGLLALRTPSAIPIAAAIAVFDALPIFGTGAVMIPWLVVELLGGRAAYAGGLAILYGIVTVVRNMIEPKIVGDTLGLNPIVSLVSIYLGYRLFGVWGMIAMPMVTQIALELHRRGTIRLFRERGTAEGEAQQKDGGVA